MTLRRDAAAQISRPSLGGLSGDAGYGTLKTAPIMAPAPVWKSPRSFLAGLFYELLACSGIATDPLPLPFSVCPECL